MTTLVAEKPDIVFIMCDDLGCENIEATGTKPSARLTSMRCPRLSRSSTGFTPKLNKRANPVAHPLPPKVGEDVLLCARADFRGFVPV